MLPQLSDTHPKSEQFQLSLIRRASVAERIAKTRSLSRTVIRLSRRAIARANPNLNEEELNLLFITLHYGREIADRVRKYLTRKKL